MKTAEQMREECAKVVETLEGRWRESAAKQQAIYDRAWIGATGNRQNAETLNAAADGLKAIVRIIRNLPLSEEK